MRLRDPYQRNSKQDPHRLHSQPGLRFEVANYKNVFIPSGLEVLDEIRKDFGGFYAELFDRRPRRRAAGYVTEYARQAGSCDPCPVPPLQPSDLYTLGSDVFGEAKGQPTDEKRIDRSQHYFGDASTWVLTRLHTRRDPEDPERRSGVRCRPVVGGRGSEGISREQPGAVVPDSVPAASRALHHPPLLGRRREVRRRSGAGQSGPPSGGDGGAKAAADRNPAPDAAPSNSPRSSEQPSPARLVPTRGK
ncbi:MAG: hypothetical protein R3F43_01010 [bacterium]